MAMITAAAVVATAVPVRAEPVVTVDRDTCRWLERHVPAADVEHRPRADVSADGLSLELPDTYAIDITVLLQERFGLPSDEAAWKGEVRVGEVVVDAGGRAWFEGQPLQPEDEHRLVALCREANGGRRDAGE